MKKYPEYKGLNLPNVAEEVLAEWESAQIFEKSITTREENKPYVFFEGPPSAMVCLVFTMLWPEPLKIYFVGTKHLKAFK